MAFGGIVVAFGTVVINASTRLLAAQGSVAVDGPALFLQGTVLLLAFCGLLLFASYPAGDMSEAEIAVLSISGSEDGLATPAKIEASRAELPPGSEFVVIDGASHAQFGAYGSQSGDGVASIGAEVAREQIATASLAFAESLAR